VPVTSWADLDKLAIARPRPDGRVTLVAGDDRGPDAIASTRPLSTLIAVSRVVRGRRVIEERHGGRGVIVYTCRHAPEYLVDAVTAAGGIVFDGARELTSPRPLALTVQLDAAFLDLASAVRRRLDARGFDAALDALEHEVRQRAPTAEDPEAWWTSILELAAVAGELVRADRPGRWIEAPTMRLPLALDLGRGNHMFPAQLAQTIVEGGGGSLRALVGLSRQATEPTPSGRAMVVLCARTAVPIDRLSWAPLVPAEADDPELPVVVHVEDRGEAITWPMDRGPPSAELHARAIANLAETAFEITPLELPFATIAVVTGDFYAAESVLVPARMDEVRRSLGGPTTMLIGTPARGHLVAIDASRATIDDDVMRAFVGAVAREHARAPERDRISCGVVVYTDRPLGRVNTGIADVDPDA